MTKWVVCVDTKDMPISRPNELLFGEAYKVVYETQTVYQLKGSPFLWKKSRFKEVEAPKNNEEYRIVTGSYTLSKIFNSEKDAENYLRNNAGAWRVKAHIVKVISSFDIKETKTYEVTKNNKS